MEPPPEPGRQFWLDVEQQVAAGLILAAVAGVGFLAWTVPRQLDLILANQKAIFERAAAIEVRLDRAEGNIQGLDHRITRMEARR
jgi:hypothetical protein